MRKGLILVFLAAGLSGSLCKKPTKEEEIITELPGVKQIQKECGWIDSLLPPNFPRYYIQGRCTGNIWRFPHVYTLLSNPGGSFGDGGYAYGVYRYTLTEDTLIHEERIYPVEDSDTAYVNLFDVSPDERCLAVTLGRLEMWGDYWRTESLKVVLVDLQTGREDTLPSLCSHMLDPQFSEDGKRLYVYGRYSEYDLWPCQDGSMEGVWVWDLSGGGWMGRLPLMKGDWGSSAYGSYMVERDTAWSSWGCWEGFVFPSVNPWDRDRVVMTNYFGAMMGGRLLVWEQREGKIYEVDIPKSVFFPHNLDKWGSVFFAPKWMNETTIVVSHWINGGAEAGVGENGVWKIEHPERFYREVRSCSP